MLPISSELKWLVRKVRLTMTTSEGEVVPVGTVAYWKDLANTKALEAAELREQRAQPQPALPRADRTAREEAAERIRTCRDVQGDDTFPGEPDAEAWVHRARRAGRQLAELRVLTQDYVQATNRLAFPSDAPRDMVERRERLWAELDAWFAREPPLEWLPEDGAHHSPATLGKLGAPAEGLREALLDVVEAGINGRPRLAERDIRSYLRYVLTVGLHQARIAHGLVRMSVNRELDPEVAAAAAKYRLGAELQNVFTWLLAAPIPVLDARRLVEKTVAGFFDPLEPPVPAACSCDGCEECERSTNNPSQACFATALPDGALCVGCELRAIARTRPPYSSELRERRLDAQPTLRGAFDFAAPAPPVAPLTPLVAPVTREELEVLEAKVAAEEAAAAFPPGTRVRWPVVATAVGTGTVVQPPDDEQSRNLAAAGMVKVEPDGQPPVWLPAIALTVGDDVPGATTFRPGTRVYWRHEGCIRTGIVWELPHDWQRPTPNSVLVFGERAAEERPGGRTWPGGYTWQSVKNLALEPSQLPESAGRPEPQAVSPGRPAAESPEEPARFLGDQTPTPAEGRVQPKTPWDDSDEAWERRRQRLEAAFFGGPRGAVLEPKPEDDELERLTGVAMLTLDGLWSLPAPARHHHVIHAYVQAMRKRCKGQSGFITSRGRFVTRDAAMEIAAAAKQLIRTPAGVLTSEDLWATPAPDGSLGASIGVDVSGPVALVSVGWRAS